MIDAKKFHQSLTYLGTLSLAVTIPLIVFKVLRAIHLKRSYNALSAKVVVITGASSGLGEALAHEFHKQGCQVVLCARRRQELERVRTDLLNLPPNPSIATVPPIIHPLDLSDLNTLPNHVDKILALTGNIDILVNNGGVSHRGTVLDTHPDVDVRIMSVNYFGAVALTKAFLPSMVKGRRGQIVFVNSVQGLVALPERSAYAASKHAMQAFADTLRAEMARFDIGVTMISPGYIKTELSRNALTGSGGKYGEMDAATEKGYSPEYVAVEIVKAVAEGKKEVVLATLVPRLAIYLRKFIPSLYFYVMVKRAKKSVS